MRLNDAHPLKLGLGKTFERSSVQPEARGWNDVADALPHVLIRACWRRSIERQSRTDPWRYGSTTAPHA